MKNTKFALEHLSKAKPAAPAKKAAAKPNAVKKSTGAKPTAWGVQVLKKIEAFRRALAT